MAIAVNVNISIDGAAPLADYHSVSIRQDLLTHHSFQVAVPYELLETNRDDGFFHEAHTRYCGKLIEIELTPKVEAKNKPLKFKGLITHIALSNSADFAPSFVLSGFSPTYLLEGGTRRRTFVKKGLKEIFEAVLRPYAKNQLECDALAPQHKEPLEYTVQYGESDHAFLRRLADEYGEWFYYDGLMLALGPPYDQNLLPFVVQGTQGFSLAAELKPNTFVLTGYDYLTNEAYMSNSQGQSLSQLNNFSRTALEQSDALFTMPAALLANRRVHGQQHLDETVQTWKETLASTLVTFQGIGENPGFEVGRVIDVRGGKDGKEPYGRYRLTEVTHSVQADEYHNAFVALPATAKHPPANALVQSPQGVPELAKVFDLNDPERLGRIRVRYKWPAKKQEDTETDWVRVSTPYSGNGYGHIFIPEEGSQVLVGYEQGNPAFPVVLGNLFHAKNPEEAEYTSNNNALKSFTTAGGNSIAFEDTLGDERITIENRNWEKRFTRLEISFGDEGEIILKAGGDISLFASKRISLTAERIYLDATKGVTINGGSSVDISGRVLDLDATVAATLSGKETQVSSKTITTIKGPLVKIN